MVNAIRSMDVNVHRRSGHGARLSSRAASASGLRFSDFMNQPGQSGPSASYQSFESQIAAAKAATAFFKTPSAFSAKPRIKPLVTAVSEDD